METYAKSLDISKKFDTDGFSHSFWTNTSKGQLLDKLLFFIKAVFEYVFGMHIGFAIGWLIGLCIGYSYVEHFEPVYFNDLSRVAYWRLMPYRFALNGAAAGLTGGIIVIAIINNKLLNQRVVSMYKNGITNPNEIAEILGKSVGKIERKIN